MIDETIKVLSKVDQEHALTAGEIAEIINETEKKLTGVLKRMRIKGIIAFEKRNYEKIAKIIYANKELPAEKKFHVNAYFYWGRL